MTIWGDIALDGARRAVTIRRLFDAEPAEVWRALSEPERLARWIGVVDVHDGRYTLTVAGEPGARTVGTVLVCEEPRRIVATWKHETEADTELHVDLSSEGDGCELVLTHRRVQAVGASEYGAGWEDFLAKLAREVGSPPEFSGFDTALEQYREREAALVAGEFSRAGDRSGVRLERLLDAAAADVWSALTEPDRIGRWLWPVIDWPDDPARVRPLKLGDRFVLGDANMPDGRQPFTVLAFESLTSITLAWGEAETPVEFRVSPDEHGTVLTLVQAPAPDAFAAGKMRSGPDYAAGWHALVDGLTLMLAGQEVSHPDGLWPAAYRVYST